MNRKIITKVVLSLVAVIAVIWILFRACSIWDNREEKLYFIGYDSTWRPFDLRGKEKNAVIFFLDIIREIGEDQGFRANLFEVGPFALIDGLETKSYQAVLTTLTPSLYNRQRYVFSDPIYRVGPVLVVRDDEQVTGLNQMEGRILGIENGILQNTEIQEPLGAVIIPFDTTAEVLENLDRRVIDGAILDALRAHVFTDGFYKGRLKVVTTPFSDKAIRLVTLNTPENHIFIEKVNESLRKFKVNGTYDELIKQSGLINTEVELSGES